jgi:hypothetical protein
MATAAVRLAMAHFGDNLRFAFVGGSYGARCARRDSDVDVFATLWEPAVHDELRFASALRELHRAHDLRFEHCGELFDVVTLEHLLTLTESWLRAVPELQHVGCYHGDCILSAFRKGDVVMKFLLDPKCSAIGDAGYLAALERRAVRYFEEFPMERIQTEKGRLSFPRGDRVAAVEESLRELAASPDYVHTPLGVSLHRWFGARALQQRTFVPSKTRENVAPDMRRQCPLTMWGEHTATGSTVRHQCLAHTPALAVSPHFGRLGPHVVGPRVE